MGENNFWADRRTRIGTETAGELAKKYNRQNYRLHPEAQQAAVEGSLDELGFIDAVSVSEKVDKLFDGHLRVELALLRFGEDFKLPVDYYDLDEAETAKALLYRDMTAQMAEINIPALQELRFEMPEFDNPEFDEFLTAEFDFDFGGGDGSNPPKQPPPIDRAEELQEKWQVKSGDIWHMGEHRLICADCREPETWERLLDGQKVNGVFTSPPYAEQRKKQYGGVPTVEYVEWWEAVQANVRDNLTEDGSFFVNIKPASVNYERQLYVFDLVIAMKRRWEWRFIDEFCWKQGGIPGDPKKMGKFKNQFEPVYQFALDDYKFIPDAVKVESESAILDNNFQPGFARNFQGKSNAFSERRIGKGFAYPGNILEIHTSEAYGHEAAFPVGLPTFFIKAYSDPGDLWLDPFVGSGTTIIAAHNEGRTGYGIERLEKYCSITLERFAQHTGIQPQLIE